MMALPTLVNHHSGRELLGLTSVAGCGKETLGELG